jgi:predicted dehydrogenase
MKNIMIIGAGQLGSRHLQGALQSEIALNIIVVDPFQKSLDVAEQRANEISLGNSDTRISYITQIKSNVTIDVCIIATTANIRFSVFKELIDHCKVENIIFEKVLFQKENEYSLVGDQLKQHGINAWVNCPRRVYPAYKKIQSLLSTEKSLSLSVKGSNWGLACNGIHFIDLFAFISQKFDFEISTTMLRKDVVESKRHGFYEVFGTLIGQFNDDFRFELNCSDDEAISIQVNIVTPNYEVNVDELQNKLSISHNGEKSDEAYYPLYQSQLTHLNIEEIVKMNFSSLTPFSESEKIHIPFIKAIKHHVESSLDKELDACPIT